MTAQPSRLTAKDVMKRELVTVRADADFWEVARILASNKITGAPVVDAQGEVVGVVSQTDLVRHLKDGLAPASRACDYYEDHVMDCFGPLRGLLVTAGDLMNPHVIHAAEDTPVDRLSRLMLKHRVHRILITRGRKILGVVGTMDLLRVI